MPEIAHISFVEDLARMQPVTLEEMKSVKLMNRIDAKYLTNESTLRSVLSDAAAAGYRVLVTEGERQSPYDSVYFDTPLLKNFRTDRNVHLQDAMMTTAQKVAELGIRFALNLLVCWILMHGFYYKKSRRRDYYFTFMVFSSAMLTLLYIMGNVEVGVGLTLGLFAIFGVIRYRTETVPIENMEIGHVDFLKDLAFIKVYYHLPKGESNSVNMITRAKDYVE